jgi:hypothetical protein
MPTQIWCRMVVASMAAAAFTYTSWVLAHTS